MASVKKLPSGRYQARWREFSGGPQQARNFRLRKDAESFLDSVRGQLVAGTYVNPDAGKVTFGGYVEHYLSAQVWRDRTARAQRTAINRALAMWADRPMASIKTVDARGFVAALAAHLAASTVMVNVTAVSGVFRQAVTDGVIARNPFNGVKRPKSDAAPVRPLTVEQVRTLHDAADPDFRLAVVLGAALGLRMSEARGLTLDRVEFLRRQVRIDRQAMHGQRGWAPPKSKNSDRTVPADDTVLDAINVHVAEFGVGEDGLLVRGVQTDAMHSYGKWGDKWDRARTAAKLPGVRYHDLRHHYASELLGHGVSIVAVAAAMGDDPATVLRTYAHLTQSDDDRIRAVVRQLWTPEVEQSPSELRTV